MCGIAGFVGDVGAEVPADSLARMCAAIRHRGPDDEGGLLLPGAALGMRRLSIIDVAGGHQPVANEDGSIQIVFNGEIYNHRQLQVELERAGHVFRSHSDTEAIVHAYEENDLACVNRLRGMFAFAVWDARQSRLMLARDRVGIKPLYYAAVGAGLVFASELRALLALPCFQPRINRVAVAQYLSFGYVPDPSSVFDGVYKLPPGHHLTWDRQRGARLQRYWSPATFSEERVDEREAVTQLRALLADAVECHLESEVPLGAFLSGGIDSSTVVALMARAVEGRVRSFSIGFEEPEFNEAPHAAAVARAIGTEHTELIVRPDADALVDEVVRAFDEPFADSSALPTYLVSRLAREHVTVALSGDGGDELFGGYTRYAATLSRRELRTGSSRRVLRSLARSLPRASLGRNRLLDLARTRRGQYACTVAAPLDTQDGGIGRDDLASQLDSLDALLDPWFDEVDSRDFATQMMLVDFMSYLPGDILTKVDRMSMAVSLEARVPLLDHHVVEFALRLPSALKIHDGCGKWILRRAIEGVVPPMVLSHPKRGFAVPLAAWFRGPLRHRIDTLDGNERLLEYVDGAAVKQTVREHLMGRRDHSALLWRLLVLALWLEYLEHGDLARPSESGRALYTIIAGATA